MKEELKGTLKGLMVIIGFMGSPIYVPFILDNTVDYFSKPKITAPHIMYSGTLKRGQLVGFKHNNEDHRVTFDSLRVHSLESAPFKTEGLERSVTRYFTLDGESRQIVESIISDIEHRICFINNQNTHLDRTKDFRIYPNPHYEGDTARAEI